MRRICLSRPSHRATSDYELNGSNPPRRQLASPGPPGPLQTDTSAHFPLSESLSSCNPHRQVLRPYWQLSPSQRRPASAPPPPTKTSCEAKSAAPYTSSVVCWINLSLHR